MFVFVSTVKFELVHVALALTVLIFEEAFHYLGLFIEYAN